MSSKLEKAAGTLYSGAASVGRTFSLIGAIFATFMGIGAIVYGIYQLFRHDPDHIKQFDKTSGWMAIGGGLFIIAISWTVYYFTTKSKAFAAITGAGDVYRMITGN